MCARTREMYNNASEEKNKTEKKTVHYRNKFERQIKVWCLLFVEKGSMLNEKPILKDMAFIFREGKVNKEKYTKLQRHFSSSSLPLCVFLHL